mgnify:CR=1 FL=1
MRPAPEAQLRLAFRSEEEARAIYEAIRPDNELLPQGLSIEGALSGHVVELHVVCEKGLESLWATLDDLLACVQAAERALEQVKHGPSGPEAGGPARI